MAKDFLIALVVFSITVAIGIRYFTNNEEALTANSHSEMSNLITVSKKANSAETYRPLSTAQKANSRENSVMDGRYSDCKDGCPSKEVISLIAESLGEGEAEIMARQEKYESAIQKINENPDQIVPELAKAINHLSVKDEGYRLYIVNLAMQANSNQDLKLEFVREYFSKSKFESKNGILSENSESASTAIEYLGKNIKTQADYDEVKRIIEDNINDEDVKISLLEKLSIFDLTKL